VGRNFFYNFFVLAETLPMTLLQSAREFRGFGQAKFAYVCWLVLRFEPIYTTEKPCTGPAASKNDARFKRGQN